MIGDDSVECVPKRTGAEIRAEIRADLDERCRIMRVQNNNIQKALSTSSSK